MSKQIKVVVKQQQGLTPTGRRILFTKLKESVKSIKGYHYDNFLEMIENKKIFSNSNILTLLIKDVEKFIIPVNNKCDTDCFVWQSNTPVLTADGKSIPSNSKISSNKIKFVFNKREYLNPVDLLINYNNNNIEQITNVINYVKHYYYNSQIDYLPLKEIPKLKKERHKTNINFVKDNDELYKYVYGNVIKISSPSEIGIPHISILYDLYQNRLSEIKLLKKLENTNDYNTRIKELDYKLEKNRIAQQVHIKDKDEKLNDNIKNGIAKTIFNKDYYNLKGKDVKKVDILFQIKINKLNQIKDNKCNHLKWMTDTDLYCKEIKKNTKRKKNQLGILECKLCNRPSVCSHVFVKYENAPTKIEQIYKNNYVDSVDSNNIYYCKYCGENLITLSLESISKFKGGEFIIRERIKDELSSYMYGTIRRIINTYVNILIGININNLINDILENSYIHVKDILFTYKKMSESTVESIKKLYSSIYLIAGLTVFMNSNPKILKWSSTVKIGGIKVQNKTKINIIKSVTLIKYLNKALIRSLPMITMNTVGIVFTKAMKQVMGLKDGTYVDTLPVEFLINSPIYVYAYSTIKKYKPKIKFTAIKDVLNVKKLSEIKKLPNLYHNINIRKPWNGSDEYSFGSYKHFYNYIKNNLYTQYAYGNKKIADHRKEYLRLKKIEDKILKKYYLIDYEEQYVEKIDKTFNNSNTDLSKAFCNTGKPHLFNIYVYKNGKTVFDVSPKNINEYMNNQKKNKFLRESKIINVRCCKCNTLLNETVDNGIKEKLDILDKKKSFFILYATKCPKKFIHNFNENDICTHCGVSIQDLSNKNDDYFNQNEHDFDVYVKNKKNKYKPQKNIPIEYKKIPEEKINTDKKFILELEKKLNIDQKINSLGTETRYKIKTEINRLLAIRQYSQIFLIEYEKMLNGTFDKTDETSDINVSVLPIIKNFTNNFLYYFNSANTEIKKEYADNLLNIMCENMLKVYNSDPLGQKIIKKIIKMILLIEKNKKLSKKGFKAREVENVVDFDKSESTIDEEVIDNIDDEIKTDIFSFKNVDTEFENENDDDYEMSEK